MRGDSVLTSLAKRRADPLVAQGGDPDQVYIELRIVGPSDRASRG